MLSKQLRNKFFLHSREVVENTVNYIIVVT
nr:MAG TPA_asm: hypothetical protein [Caudoviricetes sp.]